MKTFTFLNPGKRRKSAQANPMKSKRNAKGQFTSANPKRRRRSVRRNATRALARSNPTRSIIRRRRRASRPRAIARRVRRNPSRMRRGGRAIKRYLSRETGILAASVVGGFTLTNYLLTTYGASLPGLVGPAGVNRWVRAAYGVGLPIVAGAITLRFARQPRVAEGLVVAGLINGINEAVQYFQDSQATPAPAPTEGTSAFLTPGNGAPTPGYQASNAFGAYPMEMSGPYESQSAFGSSAWG